MSDTNGHNERAAAALRKDGGIPIIQLLITFNPATQEVRLDGPLNDPAIFHEMLKLASLTYYRALQQAKQPEPPRIVPATVIPMPPKTS